MKRHFYRLGVGLAILVGIAAILTLFVCLVILTYSYPIILLPIFILSVAYIIGLDWDIMWNG